MLERSSNQASATRRQGAAGFIRERGKWLDRPSGGAKSNDEISRGHSLGGGARGGGKVYDYWHWTRRVRGTSWEEVEKGRKRGGKAGLHI